MPEQDPIPPRRAARRHSPGEDDEVPPWANLPPVRPRRAAGPGNAPQHGPRPDGFRAAAPRRGGAARPAQDSFRDGPALPEQQPPWRDQQQPYPGQGAPPRHEPPPPYEPPSQYEPPAQYEPSAPYDSGPRPAASYLGGPARPPNPGGPTSPGNPAGPVDYFSTIGPAGPSGGSYQPPGPFPGPQESQSASAPGYAADPVRLADDYDGPEAAAFAPDGGQPPPRRSRALGSRASRALLRKRRRSLVMAGAAVVVIAAVISVVLLKQGGGQAANISGDFITSFQPGELRSVPNACDVIPAATVQQYLPGQVKEAAPQPINSNLGSGSACNWTLDHQPTYRLLEVNVLAYAPNGLPAGNGSATSAATDAYTQQYQEFQTPPKGGVSGQSTVTALPGVGDAAFSVMQVFHVGGAVSDTATVVIRFHNVIVQAELSGLEHSNKGHYGPVSQSQLSQGAQAFAQAAYAALH